MLWCCVWYLADNLCLMLEFWAKKVVICQNSCIFAPHIEKKLYLPMKKWMQCLMAVILIAGTSALSSCSTDHDDNPVTPEPEGYKGVPLVILDTDIGSSTDYSTLPDGWQLYRRLLAAQPDHLVSICSTGFVSCLTQLLASKPDEFSPLSGIELVQQKVKCLYLMAGIFTHSERGIVTLTDQFGTSFMPLPTGNARYQKPGSETWCHEMLERIRKACIGNH